MLLAAVLVYFKDRSRDGKKKVRQEGRALHLVVCITAAVCLFMRQVAVKVQDSAWCACHLFPVCCGCVVPSKMLACSAQFSATSAAQATPAQGGYDMHDMLEAEMLFLDSFTLTIAGHFSARKVTPIAHGKALASPPNLNPQFALSYL